ncbi:CHAT domain-containing protein [Crocosphaera sp. Alani8]|uniref:CHAT domain-containing protein n=1 Tax=Crocosphaera sp. Alani8 TaxID=3038952 RepID=UPI00313EE624
MLGLFYRYYRLVVLFCLVILLVISFPLRAVSTDVLRDLNQAQTLIDQGNFNLATTILESIEENLPKKAYPYYQAITANLFLRQGLFNQAIDIYSRLKKEQFGKKANNTHNYLNLLDNYIQAALGRARVYSFLASEDIDRQNEFLTIVDSDRILAHQLAIEESEIASSASVEAKIRASLNLAQMSPPSVDLSRLALEIDALPSSEMKVLFSLQLAKFHPKPLSLLKKALSLSFELQNPLNLSWSWGALAEHYYIQGLYPEALEPSLRAIWSAQQVRDWAKLSQWEWLAARIYQKLDQPSSAFREYRNALSSIKKLREDLAGSSVGQNLFYDTIEPILRDFLSFLLNQPTVSQQDLIETLDILRLHQLAELDNFFGDICEVNINTLATQEPDSIKIYTLLLPNNSYEILRFSDNSYQLISLNITEQSFKQLVLDWRSNLTNSFYGDYRPGSQKLSDILIKPIQNILDVRGIKHLIFVQDNILRNIPMSGLYYGDDNNFLVEKYVISYSLDLGGSLIQDVPQYPLIVGSSQPTPRFPNPLPEVITETKFIQELLGGTRLLNKSFTPESLSNNLQENNYQILHIASHSRFSGLSEEVQIQTGTDILGLSEFDQILSRKNDSLRNLVLSACETASGSRYSTLGIAGIGLRAEISNVLGSLWFINDQSSMKFFLDFYQFWLEEKSIAKALQKAQIKQIEQDINPVNWVNYILIS